MQKKYLEKFYGKSIFQACRLSGSQTVKNSGYKKVTAVLISHFSGMLTVISVGCLLSFFWKIQRNEDL